MVVNARKYSICIWPISISRKCCIYFESKCGNISKIYMTHFFSCHLCLHPGRWDARAHFVSYLPLSDPDNGEVMVPALRTQTSYRQTITDLETAVHLQSSSQTQTPSHISGIRGRSLIIDALECGIQGVCIDIMHAKDEVRRNLF